MKMRICAVGAATALVLGLGCRDTTGPGAFLDLNAPWVPDSTSVLASSGYTGFDGSVRAVLGDVQTWAVVWNEFVGSIQPKPSLPAVDFTADWVLVVALGSRPTGGYGIRVDSVANHGGTVVYVTTIAPGPLCAVTQLVTSPAQLVRLPRPPEPITFQDRNVATDCQ